jgi:predicted metalloprotease
MKWKGRQGSSNVEDKRGMTGKSMAGIGGGVGLVIVLIVTLLGGNPSDLLGSLNSTEPNNGSSYVESNEEKRNRSGQKNSVKMDWNIGNLPLSCIQAVSNRHAGWQLLR